MPTTLDEMNFELLPSPEATSGVLFGIGQDVSVDDEGFDPGEDNWTDEDDSNPRRGGSNFGRDTLDGPTWSWSLHVNRHRVSEAVETLGSFKTSWRWLEGRDTPGAMSTIRYRVGGRTRRIYGRPRRFAAPPSNRILNGYIPVTVDFRCADGFTYDDVESAHTLTLTPEESRGGFILPAVFPITTLPVGQRVSAFVVGGDAPAYPVIVFEGPLTNPTLEHEDWSLSLSMSIAANNSVTVDLRPWAMTALLSGGESVAGSLGRKHRLADVKLAPGPHQLLFRASSTSGSGTCTVRWANTWNSI